MYGGHITDHWDRRCNITYLEKIIKKELLTNGYLAPYFRSPDPTKLNYQKYQDYIENDLPKESPGIFGLHANAEIGYLSKESVILFQTILEVQGSGGASSEGDAGGNDIKLVETYLAKTPEYLNMIEITDQLIG